MLLVSSFLDPNNNGVDIVDVAYATGAVLSAAAVVAGAWKIWRAVSTAIKIKLVTVVQFAVEPLIDDKLAHYTYPIQPEANGGRSLPDLNRKLDRVLAAMGIDNEGRA